MLHDGPPSLACPAGRRTGPVPAGAGDGEGDLRQARIGLAVPGKAIGQHRHPMHLAVPFAAQHGARPQVGGPPAQVHGALSCFLGRSRASRAAAGSRHPGHPTDRPEADRPEHETGDGGAGEGALAARIRCANEPEAHRRRDHASAQSRRRVSSGPAAQDRS